VFLAINTNSREIHEEDTLKITALVTDPDGIEDVIGRNS